MPDLNNCLPLKYNCTQCEYKDEEDYCFNKYSPFTTEHVDHCTVCYFWSEAVKLEDEAMDEFLDICEKQSPGCEDTTEQ